MFYGLNLGAESMDNLGVAIVGCGDNKRCGFRIDPGSGPGIAEMIAQRMMDSPGLGLLRNAVDRFLLADSVQRLERLKNCRIGSPIRRQPWNRESQCEKYH